MAPECSCRTGLPPPRLRESSRHQRRENRERRSGLRPVQEEEAPPAWRVPRRALPASEPPSAGRPPSPDSPSEGPSPARGGGSPGWMPHRESRESPDRQQGGTSPPSGSLERPNPQQGPQVPLPAGVRDPSSAASVREATRSAAERRQAPQTGRRFLPPHHPPRIRSSGSPGRRQPEPQVSLALLSWERPAQRPSPPAVGKGSPGRPRRGRRSAQRCRQHPTETPGPRPGRPTGQPSTRRLPQEALLAGPSAPQEGAQPWPEAAGVPGQVRRVRRRKGRRNRPSLRLRPRPP